MSDSFALKARYVFPVVAPPMIDACVSVADGRIVAVGPPAPGCPVRELGDAAIVPGFVNAHTHLEFSGLHAPLGEPGMPLVDWIRLVMAHRRGAGVSPAESVARGLAECLHGGTTTLGDIATDDWRPSARSASNPLPETVVFRECIGPTRDRVAGALAMAEAFLAAGPSGEPLHPALSPHAPYTVHRALLESLADLSRRSGVPLAMHLAESREELELLRAGTGPFRDLLFEVGAWDDDRAARHGAILEYLEQLARAPRALVIHGNYLTDAELEFLAARADTMSVVYCPRTHDWFRHDAYPLARMLALGIAVALGTDSRASNPDLDMAAEMRFVARRHPDVPAGKVLELATLAGARALGLDDRVGSLEPGKLANLAVLRVDDSSRADADELPMAPEARVIATYLRGQLASDAE